MELCDTTVEHYDTTVERCDTAVEHSDITVEQCEITVEHSDPTVESSVTKWHTVTPQCSTVISSEHCDSTVSTVTT